MSTVNGRKRESGGGGRGAHRERTQFRRRVALLQEEPQPRSEQYADPGVWPPQTGFAALLTQSPRFRVSQSTRDAGFGGFHQNAAAHTKERREPFT